MTGFNNRLLRLPLNVVNRSEAVYAACNRLSSRVGCRSTFVLLILATAPLACMNCAYAALPVPSSSSLTVGPQTVAVPAGAVIVRPKENVAALVARSSSGSIFFFQAGTYRTQQITPLNGDQFIGAKGAVLNGSLRLTNFSQSGGLFVASQQTPNPYAQVIGVCNPGFPQCAYPQDLYFDGKPLHAVASLSAVATGAWYFDTKQKNVYFADNPAGHLVELSYSPFAFGGAATNVTIQNLVVEKYASADQRGAIGDSAAGVGWKIINNEVTLNHGVGITLGSGSQASGNLIHTNGEMGVGGTGSSILLSENEIADNVWNGTDCAWECGGVKFGAVTKLTVQQNYVHDNQGDGLWDDVGSATVEYASNLVEDNLDAGISHEIGYAALIHDNVVIGNGATTYGWGWQAQIQVQNSSSTQVYDNQVGLDPVLGGNGITIVQQNRGAQYMVHDVKVFNNSSAMIGGNGVLAGWFVDYDPAAFTSGNNSFSANQYYAPVINNPSDDYWVPGVWGNDFAMWQQLGQDVTGHASVVLPNMMKPTK